MVGLKGEGTSRFCSLSQFMSRKKACFLTAALPSGPLPKRFADSLVSSPFRRLCACELKNAATDTATISQYPARTKSAPYSLSKVCHRFHACALMNAAKAVPLVKTQPESCQHTIQLSQVHYRVRAGTLMNAVNNIGKIPHDCQVSKLHATQQIVQVYWRCHS